MMALASFGATLRKVYLAHLALLVWTALAFMAGVFTMEVIAEQVAVHAIQQYAKDHHA